jgi:ABC-2 type transport system permease protein
MRKTLLIIKREYFTRVRNKTFLLSVILTPLLLFGIMSASVYFGVSSKEDVNIVVKDESGLFKSRIESSAGMKFVFDEKTSLPDLQKNYQDSGYSGILHIPAIRLDSSVNLEYLSTRQLGLLTSDKLRGKLDKALEAVRMMNAKIDTAALSKIQNSNLKIKTVKLDKEGRLTLDNSNVGVSYAIGYASSFLMYLLVLLFGTMIMQGVMEEKTSRIAEVMVSSVKPFQLMMGKIIGIAGVGLTGFFIWIIILFALYGIGLSFVSSDVLKQAQDASQGMPMSGNNMAMVESVMKIKQAVGSVNWPLIIFCFIFYFLGGFLFYASLFAAVGSVVSDNPQEAQSLTLPLTMPIIFSIIIMINAINTPSSPLAVWSSIIPFSSPIVMMARIPSGVPGTVPWWQLGVSMLSLIAGIIITTWIAAKIYRTGILLYGKKVTWKEMLKWAFKKN